MEPSEEETPTPVSIRSIKLSEWVKLMLGGGFAVVVGWACIKYVLTENQANSESNRAESKASADFYRTTVQNNTTAISANTEQLKDIESQLKDNESMLGDVKTHLQRNNTTLRKLDAKLGEPQEEEVEP